MVLAGNRLGVILVFKERSTYSTVNRLGVILLWRKKLTYSTVLVGHIVSRKSAYAQEDYLGISSSVQEVTKNRQEHPP